VKRVAGWFAGVLGLLLAVLFAFDFYKAHPVEVFCSELPESATPAAILELARSRGLPAIDTLSDGGHVAVFNQNSPFFRHACVVEFRAGRQVSRQVIIAD
jgi:hypothetical protein